MNPLVLLGAAVAFLAFTKRPTQVTTSAPQAGQPENADVTTPTFTSVPLPTKSKTLTLQQAVDEGRQVELASAPIVGISPPAEGSMPPYVYDQVPSLATFGASESPLLF